MEKLLTPIAITLIALVLGATVYRYLFYKGNKRRIPGQHRYNSNCVEMFWAKVTPLHSPAYDVQIWGYQQLEAGI